MDNLVARRIHIGAFLTLSPAFFYVSNLRARVTCFSKGAMLGRCKHFDEYVEQLGYFDLGLQSGFLVRGSYLPGCFL